MSKAPQLYKKYTISGISNFRVFATLITLKYLLPNDHHWYDFVQVVELLIEKYPNVELHLIGFSQDWVKVLTK